MELGQSQKVGFPPAALDKDTASSIWVSENTLLLGSSVYRENPSPTASVITIDPVVSGKHIGALQPIGADWQHPYEKTASAYSVYRFNSYEHRCSLVRKASSHPLTALFLGVMVEARKGVLLRSLR